MNKWKIVYQNDVRGWDEYFCRWWEVTNDVRIFKCEEKDDADWLYSVLCELENKK